MEPLEWMLAASGFTGGLTLVFLLRKLRQWLGHQLVIAPHFSPKGGCTEAIVRELNLARREILVQAYSFTSPSIAVALAAARARGAAVHIILDRANEKETFTELGTLQEQGLDVLIDAHHAIAHNKIMVVDRRTLITGSFNFTRQAEHENAENLLIIKGHPELVHLYVQNFFVHRAHAQKPGSVKESAAPASEPKPAQRRAA
jgi:phosphatidylserine/phosphatidylglycerophosphate/cardiolipin synthase-like enzyme